MFCFPLLQYLPSPLGTFNSQSYLHLPPRLQLPSNLPEACLVSLRATERCSLLLQHIPRLLGLSPATEDLLFVPSKVYVALLFFTLASPALVALLGYLLGLAYTTR